MKLNVIDRPIGCPASIPSAALDLAELGQFSALNLYTQGRSVVLLAPRMTVLDIVEACMGLEQLIQDLVEILVVSSGSCVGCRENCPMANYQGGPLVQIPEEALQEAGIEPGRKLCCQGFGDSNAVLVEPASHEHDLSDVPEPFLSVLRNSGLCMDQLNDCIVEEAIVYGNE